ncbi:hypothetical protein KSW81_002827 [Nannochloris sp. 'desiccata']|nr:hypothetical protein KSW81_002827 [Chlorella desiccata (nom. nud.)]
MTSTPKTATFVNIGERTNVTGSAAFKKLIMAGDYPAAVEVARQQVENGAQVIDVNMDEGLLDAVHAMTTFPQADRRRTGYRPRAGDDRQLQVGSDRGGAEMRLRQADRQFDQPQGRRRAVPRSPCAKCRDYGAAAVVMAFRREGPGRHQAAQGRDLRARLQADARPMAFPPKTSFSTPNIFAVATGMEEHDRYGLDFIEAVGEIKTRCPHALTSGGLSNLSFSFRGNEPVRRAIHSVFLYHAIPAGLDMAIVNAGQLDVYDTIRSGGCAMPARTWCSPAAPMRPSG